jgi:replicative DNA helicase
VSQAPEEFAAPHNYVPPNAVESEEILICGLLLAPERVPEVSFVRPEHLYFATNQKVLKAIYELSDEGVVFDPEIVWRRLQDSPEGGMQLTAEHFALYAKSTPFQANLRDHAMVVHEKWRLRQLLSVVHLARAEILSGRMKDGRAPWTAQNIISSVETSLFELTAEDQRRGLERVVDAALRGFKELEERDRQDRDESIEGSSVMTGLVELDRLISAMYSGELYVLAARPGMGKTSLLRCISLNVAHKGPAVALFTLEVPSEQMALALACTEAGVDSKLVRSRELTREDWATLTDAISRLHRLPIYVDDSPVLTIADVRSKVIRLQKELARATPPRRVGLVAVDYLQLMKGERSDNREQEVSSLSRGLKRLSKELRVPILALSQLNRKVESKQSKRPGLSDLRESGAIEQDADAIWFIYRPDYYDKDDHPGEAEIEVAKQRTGPTGVARCYFDKTKTKFYDLTDNYDEEYFEHY